MKALFIGRTTLDLIFKMDHLPKVNSKKKADQFLEAAGGPACNASIICSHLGADVTFFTVIGNGGSAQVVSNELKNLGIKYVDFSPNKKDLATSAIVVDDNGDRTIMGSPITSTDLDESITPTIEDFDIVLWDGYYPEIFDYYITHRKNKCPIVVDADRWHNHYNLYLKQIDIIISGETFTVPKIDTKSFFEKNFDQYAITKGENGIRYKDNSLYGTISVDSIIPVDTLGAGDFVHGAFCYYYIKYKDMRKALESASKVATKSCLHFGTRSWLDIEDFSKL